MDTLLFCPRCACSLATHEHAGVRLHACPRCGGCFAAASGGHGGDARSDAGVAPPLWCPCCAAPMRRFHLAATAVDFCERHGVWLEPPRCPPRLAPPALALVADFLGDLLETWIGA